MDKLASECRGHAYTRNFGVEFVSLRYFNVFGSRQDPSSPYSGVISIFCNKMLQGLAPAIYRDGLQRRDLVHVSDVVWANLIVMKHPEATARNFMVRREIRTNLLEIIKEINDLTGQNLLFIHKDVRFGDIRHSLADNTALKALGCSPLKSIREGLRELLKPEL